WVQSATVSGPPPSFGFPYDLDEIADSDAAIAAALNEAALANQVRPDSIPMPEGAFDDNAFVYAAKILSTPQYPEPNEPDGLENYVAWRVDFLTMAVAGGGGVPVPFSLVRFYLNPVTLELVTAPIVSAEGGELFPWP
ncbi:hypothetical protein K8I85_04790, partial [bacterium]|nr:hypothetical protein [bacterium]